MSLKRREGIRIQLCTLQSPSSAQILSALGEILNRQTSAPLCKSGNRPNPSQLSPWPSPNTPPAGMAGGSLTKVRKPTKQPQTDADDVTGLDSLWEGGRKSFHLTLSFIHQVSTLRLRGQALGSRVHHDGHYLHLPNTTCPVPSQETLQLCVLSSTGTHMWPRAATPALPVSGPAELCPFAGVTGTSSLTFTFV